MRIVSLLLIVLLAFQCMPHSVRVKAMAVCMNYDNVDPDEVPVLNPGSVLEDEIPHFILSLHHPEPFLNKRPVYGADPSHILASNCRIPGNQAHDVETPPPNRVA